MSTRMRAANQMIKGVRSPETYAAKQRALLAQSRIRETVVNSPVDARIEHGRWLFQCVCGSGVAAHPDWPRAHCLGDNCGRTYTNVHFPADRHAIEEELLKRPVVVTQNWWPGETVTQLRNELALQAHRDKQQRGSR